MLLCAILIGCIFLPVIKTSDRSARHYIDRFIEVFRIAYMARVKQIRSKCTFRASIVLEYLYANTKMRIWMDLLRMQIGRLCFWMHGRAAQKRELTHARKTPARSLKQEWRRSRRLMKRVVYGHHHKIPVSRPCCAGGWLHVHLYIKRGASGTGLTGSSERKRMVVVAVGVGSRNGGMRTIWIYLKNVVFMRLCGSYGCGDGRCGSCLTDLN